LPLNSESRCGRRVRCRSGFFAASVVLAAAPLTADPAAWYFPRAAVAVGCLLGLAGFCCWTATGEKRLFAAGFFGDE